MEQNEQLYTEALDAINKLFSDMSVPKSKAIENLHSLIDEIRSMIDSLEE